MHRAGQWKQNTSTPCTSAPPTAARSEARSNWPSCVPPQAIARLATRSFWRGFFVRGYNGRDGNHRAKAGRELAPNSALDRRCCAGLALSCRREKGEPCCWHTVYRTTRGRSFVGVAKVGLLTYPIPRHRSGAGIGRRPGRLSQPLPTTLVAPWAFVKHLTCADDDRRSIAEG